MKKTLRVLVRASGLLVLLAVVVSLVNTAFLAPWNAPGAGESPISYKIHGALHMHTRHSDGSGTLPDLVRAARACSLDFILISDHNTLALLDSENAVQQPLLLVGTELSLTPGHMLTYGLKKITPEKDAGGFTGILDSIAAHNGLAFVAHPFHPKIKWRGTFPATLTGVEVLNADVEWRNDGALELLGAVIALPFFEYAMNSLIDLPRRELHLWDSLSVQRRTVGIGSVDAHARIKISPTKSIKFPSYQKTFELIQDVLLLPEPLSAETAVARRQIIEALHQGHVLFGFNGLGDLRQVSMWAEQGRQRFFPGDAVPISEQDTLTIRVRLPENFPFETALYRDGVQIAGSREASIAWPVMRGGVYRIVVFQRRIQVQHLGRRNIAWAFGNPFYVVNAL